MTKKLSIKKDEATLEQLKKAFEGQIILAELVKAKWNDEAVYNVLCIEVKRAITSIENPKFIFKDREFASKLNEMFTL